MTALATFYKTDFEAPGKEGPDLRTEHYCGQRHIQTVAYRNGVRVIINYGQHEYFLEVGKPVAWTALWDRVATFLGAAGENAVVREEDGSIEVWPLHQVCHYCPEGGPVIQDDPDRDARLTELAELHSQLWGLEGPKSEAMDAALKDAGNRLVQECAAIWGPVEPCAIRKEA